jgi:hypothetical protein
LRTLQSRLARTDAQDGCRSGQLGPENTGCRSPGRRSASSSAISASRGTALHGVKGEARRTTLFETLRAVIDGGRERPTPRRVARHVETDQRLQRLEWRRGATHVPFPGGGAGGTLLRAERANGVVRRYQAHPERLVTSGETPASTSLRRCRCHGGPSITGSRWRRCGAAGPRCEERELTPLTLQRLRKVGCWELMRKALESGRSRAAAQNDVGSACEDR